MEPVNNSQNLRIIDRQVLGLGLEDRARRLDQFLDQHLKTYLTGSLNNDFQAPDQSELARAFGELLAKITTDMLSYERAHKIETNWNGPEEEQGVCRLTAELGLEYYFAPEASRPSVVSKYVAIFSQLPLPLEELALEEAAVHIEGWEDEIPIEERRIWMKLSKSSRPFTLDTHCGPISDVDPSSTKHPRRK